MRCSFFSFHINSRLQNKANLMHVFLDSILKTTTTSIIYYKNFFQIRRKYQKKNKVLAIKIKSGLILRINRVSDEFSLKINGFDGLKKEQVCIERVYIKWLFFQIRLIKVGSCWMRTYDLHWSGMYRSRNQISFFNSFTLF